MFPSEDNALPRSIWLYLLCGAFFIYLFVSILQFRVDDNHNWILAGMYLIEFGVHEVSHIVTAFLPSIWVAAAGSIGEIGFTLLVLVATLKARAYFAAGFAGLWVMFAMHNVGRYIADARAQALPLVGPGETMTHDWHFILNELGLLARDKAIGGTVTIAGTVIGLLALLWCGYLLLVKVVRLNA